jgi:hypothetical protein
MAKRKKNTAGKMSMDEIRQSINKRAGMNVAHNLEKTTQLKLRIGSRLAQLGWMQSFARAREQVFLLERL